MDGFNAVARTMDGQRFFVKGRTFDATDPQLQDALARVYGGPERARCMCVRGGVEMYVAKYRDYVLKRMPDTGSEHHPTCPSYEPERSQSGLGQLMGEAIIRHSPESVELRLDFPLSRYPGQAIGRGEAEAPAAVSAPRHGMSLRALMHFLWESAGFNRWYPAMKDKRSQAVLRKYLLDAADGMQTKGIRLAERLYVPEQFQEDRKEEAAARRRNQLAVLQSPEADVQFKMAIVLGEFKAVESSPYGRRVWVKHMPDCPLQVDAKPWKRIERVFGPLFEAREADTRAKLKLILCALIYAKREHIYQIDTASFMLVTENWIPIEGVHEADLIQALTEQSRRFLKPLRYDATSAAHFPNVLLLDSGDKPTSMHIVSGFMEAKDLAAKEKALKAQDTGGWVWHTERPMPPLPEPRRDGIHYAAQGRAPTAEPAKDSPPKIPERRAGGDIERGA